MGTLCPGARTRVVNPIILATSWDYKILNVRIGKISPGLQSVTQMSVKTSRARFTQYLTTIVR